MRSASRCAAIELGGCPSDSGVPLGLGGAPSASRGGSLGLGGAIGLSAAASRTRGRRPRHLEAALSVSGGALSDSGGSLGLGGAPSASRGGSLRLGGSALRLSRRPLGLWEEFSRRLGFRVLNPRKNPSFSAASGGRTAAPSAPPIFPGAVCQKGKMRRLRALGAYAFHLVYGRLFPPRPEAPCVVCLDPDLARGVPALFQPSGRGASFHTVAGALRRKPRYSPFEHTESLMDGEIELRWANRESSMGVVLLFHGLGGSSDGVAITSLAAAFARLGFAAVAYKPASVGDAAAVVRHVAARGLPLYAVGVSAGADALVKHLGTRDAFGATTTPILAAVSMCCAPDLLGNHSRTPPPASGSWLPAPGFRPLAQYDERQTSQLLKVSELLAVRVPLLCIGARNDPVADASVCEEAALMNRNVVSVTTCDGGHAGWMTSAGCWGERVAVDWLAARHAARQAALERDSLV